MSIDVSVVFWTIVNFCLLSVLLDRFLFRPVKSFMRERQLRMESGIRSGEESRRMQQAEQRRLQERAAVAFAKEAEQTRAESARCRQQYLEELEQINRSVAQRRNLMKETLAAQREQMSQELTEQLPDLMAALSHKFLDPLAGELSVSMPALSQELSGCLEDGWTKSQQSVGSFRRARQNSRRSNAMREGNPELDRLAEVLAAELPTLSSAVVKKIMGTVE